MMQSTIPQMPGHVLLQSLDFKWKYGLISSEGLLQVTMSLNAMHQTATFGQTMLSLN